MFEWLRFGRNQGSARTQTVAEEPIVSADQLDLPTPEQRELFANFINSGNATFGVVNGSREFDVVDAPETSGPGGTSLSS